MFTRWGISIGLLLIFALTRYHNLDAMPVVYDEAEGIRYAKLVWTGPEQWLTGAQNGRLLYVWWVALFWPFTGSLWLSRAVNLLWGLVGLAAIVTAGSLLGSPRRGWLAAGLYILSPLAFFYDRIVLGEHMQVALQALLILTSILLVRHRKRWAAVAAAGLMVALWMAKGTGILWIGGPLFALLLVPPHLWRERIAFIATTYALFGLVSVVLAAFLLLQGFDFGWSYERRALDLDLVRTEQYSGVQVALLHVANYARNIWALMTSSYLPGVLMPVLVLGIGLALWRRATSALALLGMVVLPILALSVALSRFEVRYLVPALPPLVLLAAVGWTKLTDTWPWQARLGLLAALAAAILAGGSLRFMSIGWTRPTALALPTLPPERGQYLLDWSSGSGVPELASFIQSASTQSPTDLVVTDIGQLVLMSTYLGPESHLYTMHDYDEPNLRIKIYYEGLDNPYASLAHPCRQVFLLARYPRDASRVAALAVPAEELLSIPKPDGAREFRLYKVYPTEEVLAVHAPAGCSN